MSDDPFGTEWLIDPKNLDTVKDRKVGATTQARQDRTGEIDPAEAILKIIVA